MAKKVAAYIRLKIKAGVADAAQPVGLALGQCGVNVKGFCKVFNDATKHLEAGLAIPVVISVYEDKSFTFLVNASRFSVAKENSWLNQQSASTVALSAA